MYLYFDKTGKLKEIINDEALRQGNYGINTIYIYIEDREYTAIDVSYLLPSQLIVGPQHNTTFTDPTDSDDEDCFIPFNKNRDLHYFKYYTPYQFLVIDLTEDLNGNGPLDQAGLVHCDMQALLDGGTQLQLGEVNFIVEVNSVYNQREVASQEYLSLSNYQYLRQIIDNYEHPTLEVGTVATGAPGTDAVITNVGTSLNAVFDFTIPRGDKGETGTSITGVAFTSSLGAVDTYTIYFSDGTTSTFEITNGAQGLKGDKGDKGDPGVVTQSAGLIGFNVVNGRLHAYTSVDEPLSVTINANGKLIYSY